jgi:archaeosortase C (PEF-CTERM variant)
MNLPTKIKKTPFLFVLPLLLIAAVALLAVLDYFNLESLSHFNNSGFYFDVAWKGRMLLPLFIAIFILEALTNRNLKLSKHTRGKTLRLIAILLCASLPLIYVVGENVLGVDKLVVASGEALRGEYWHANLSDWANFVNCDWPLSMEFLVFALSATATVFLAYGKAGLKAFSISLALICGITAIFFVDTLFPYGALKPLQMFALPTTACATAVLDFLGYQCTMSYSSGPNAVPAITVYPNGNPASAGVNWPCAGVQSLFLFVLIMFLLLRKSDMSFYRKTIYFLVGLAVTYFVNVMRIVTIFAILFHYGTDAAIVFHASYGELFFIAWILLYMLLIIGIQKFGVIEKIKGGAHALQTKISPKKTQNPAGDG